MFLKRYLSETSRYTKIVAIDYWFTVLVFDKFVSKKATKSQIDKGQKMIQVNETIDRLMNSVPRTTQHDMRWRRRCENDHKLIYETLENEDYKQRTQYIPVSWTQEEVESGVWDNKEDDEEDKTKDMYVMSRKEAVKILWAD